MSRQILFPTDFSPCAERAFSHAAHLSAWYGARLHVLSVLDSEQDPGASPMNYLPLGRDELAAELGIVDSRDAFEDETGDPLVASGDVVNVTLQAPSPWRAILNYADENDIDLIVMGTHGRHGVDRMLMGSVAEQVVRRAQCPVLTVRVEERGNRRGPIVVPIDFSTFTHGVISQAVDLAEAYKTELKLLHIIEPITLPTVYGVDPMPSVVPEMEVRATKALEELGSERVPERVSWSAKVLVGHATHEIIAWTDEVGARMIVIATHGLTGLKRLLMGSVTEQVVREAPCPVFTVRSLGKQLTSAAAKKAANDKVETM